MKTSDLSTHIAATYSTLRMSLVIIGFALPPLLALGYSIATNDWQLQGSLSEYYHAGGGVVRGWFVGLLFAVGALLFVYHGFTALEDFVLNFAGIFALGVAMVPMPLERRRSPSTASSRSHFSFRLHTSASFKRPPLSRSSKTRNGAIAIAPRTRPSALRWSHLQPRHSS